MTIILFNHTIAAFNDGSELLFSVTSMRNSSINTYQLRKRKDGHCKFYIDFTGYNFEMLSQRLTPMESFEENNADSFIGLTTEGDRHFVSYKMYQRKGFYGNTVYLKGPKSVQIIANLLSAFHSVSNRYSITQTQIVVASAFVIYERSRQSAILNYLRDHVMYEEHEGRIRSHFELFLCSLQDGNCYLSSEKIEQIEDMCLRISRMFHIPASIVMNELRYVSSNDFDYVFLPNCNLLKTVRLAAWFP